MEDWKLKAQTVVKLYRCVRSYKQTVTGFPSASVTMLNSVVTEQPLIYYHHALHLVQCCTLYGSATHIANTRYRTNPA